MNCPSNDTHPLLVVIILISSACSSSDGNRWLAATDSAGIRIVESPEPALEAGSWSLSRDPELTIGVTEGDPAYQFNWIATAMRLSDGRYVVAQLSDPPEIRFYDARGVHIRTIGRSGSGPGEFVAIAWMDLPGPDTIRVFDFWAARYTYFNSEGDLLSVVPVQTIGGLPPRSTLTTPGLANGEILAWASNTMPSAASAGLGRSSTYMLRVGRQGERVDSLTTVLDRDYAGGPDGTVAMPLGRQTAFAARDSSIFVATGDDYQVDVYDLSGSLVRIQRRDGQRRVTSETNKSAWFAALLAEALDDREAAWVRERYRSVPFPERLPAYSQRMLHDDAGNLWVEQFAAPDDTVRVWDVFDNRGQYVVEVKVPSPFAISQVVSDQVLGIWIDTLDIQTVRAYKLQRVGQ